jgi:hypothetical protein
MGISLSLAALLPLPGNSGELPARSIPAGFGVSVHDLGPNFSQLDGIVDAGFHVVRLDVLWDRIEKEKGVYDWSFYDQLTEALKKRQLRPHFVLLYSNPLYADKTEVTDAYGKKSYRVNAPSSAEQIDAFGAWATAVAARYAELHPIIEIWNEPESFFFWPPQADPKAYAALLNASCKAIRAKTPDATVISAGLSTQAIPRPTTPEPPYLVTFLKSVDSNCVDALSIHPYLRIPQIEGTIDFWSHLGALTNKYASPRTDGQPLRWVNSEWGLSTYSGKNSVNSQAAYLVKMTLLNLASDIPLTVWYDWSDVGDDDSNPEHRYGIIKQDNTPKPALLAMKNMVQEINGYHFFCRAKTSVRKNTGLIFTDSSETKGKLVLWNTEEAPEQVIGDLSALRALQPTNMLGEGLDLEGLARGTAHLRPEDVGPTYSDIGRPNQTLCIPSSSPHR